MTPREVCHRNGESARCRHQRKNWIQVQWSAEQESSQAAEGGADGGFGEQSAERHAPQKTECCCWAEDESADTTDHAGDDVDTGVGDGAAKIADDEEKRCRTEEAGNCTGHDAGGSDAKDDSRETEGRRHDFDQRRGAGGSQ